MNPLLCVNWCVVNKGFCALMWGLVVVLAVVILSHAAHPGLIAHHQLHAGRAALGGP
jgi:hypothetical protein